VNLLQDYGDRVLGFDSDAAQLWARLRVPLGSPTKAAAVEQDALRAARHLIQGRSHFLEYGGGVFKVRPGGAPCGGTYQQSCPLRRWARATESAMG
jgi:hypothetical protein